METQSIGIKFFSGTCDVKVLDKLGEITILSLDEGSYRFFSDISNISCEPVEGVEGHYSNCCNKDPIELKPKEQGFDEATPGAVGSGFDWSLGNLFKNKKDHLLYLKTYFPSLLHHLYVSGIIIIIIISVFSFN
jgi:hypothetical protein